MNFKLIRSGILAAAVLALPFAANAADLPRPSYKAPAYVAPSYSTWSGFYVGVNAGYGFGNSTWDVPTVNPKPKGFLAGGTLGYNYQTGIWVWGLEGDFDYSGMKSTVDCGLGTCETRNNWLATARGRLGYAGWTNFMPYITGGGAYGGLKATNSALGSASDSKFGYALGAGIEYMLYSNWSLKGEYLYVNLGKFDCGVSCGGVSPDNVTFKANILRAGLNYRF
ncbi:MAG: outer membrane protein [Pseudolabrys sp.]